jgi:hypothetical protein
MVVHPIGLSPMSESGATSIDVDSNAVVSFHVSLTSVQQQCLNKAHLTCIT